MLFPPLAQALIDGHGWRSAYFILGGLVLCTLPLTALFVRERPTSGTHTGEPERGRSAAQGLRSREFWIVVAILFLSSISINAAITHMPALLNDRGVTAGSAALAASILGLSSFCGRLLTGVLLDRFFGPRVGAVVLTASAAGILLLAGAGSAGGGLMAAALIGVGLGAEADITPYLLTRYFGLRSFSTLFGFTWTAYAVAGAIGPVIMGRAFDLTGSYTSMLTGLSALTLASAGLYLWLPRYPELDHWTGVLSGGAVEPPIPA